MDLGGPSADLTRISAWADINNNAGTLELGSDSFNVSGVTDGGGSGVFTVSWDRDFASNIYAVTGSGTATGRTCSVTSRSVGSADFALVNASGTGVDGNATVMAIGRQG